MTEIEIASKGIYQLYEMGAVVTILVLIDLALIWFCRYLIQRNTALSDKFATVVEQNTKAFIELREAIRNANH